MDQRGGCQVSFRYFVFKIFVCRLDSVFCSYLNAERREVNSGQTAQAGTLVQTSTLLGCESSGGEMDAGRGAFLGT